jgi:tRNA A-37 threonylcarbamoyl transferase component Bud32
MSNHQLGIGDALGALVSPGDVVAGKYRVQRVIGSGGMGVVIEAWHLQLDERVAIKFLLPEAANEEATGRFEREARAAFKIKSEHVARVIDVGKLEGRVPYMVMEYLEGSDLGERLTDRQPLPIKDAVDYVLQATEAVAEAHVLGIVHRDLKPENLFLTRRPDDSVCVKVLDFGLSKVPDNEPNQQRERALTGTKQVMGTPQYMSPEQWMSAKDVGPASDQWALGVILYELLTGHQPFDQEHVAQLCTQVLRGDPPPLHAMRPETPNELVQCVDRCLAKEPENRYRNVAAMAIDLFRFGSPGARSSARRIAGVFKLAGQDSGEMPESRRGGLGFGMVLGAPGSVPTPPTDGAPSRPGGVSRRQAIPAGDEATLVHELPMDGQVDQAAEEAPTAVYEQTVTMSDDMRERFERMLVDDDEDGEPATGQIPPAASSPRGLAAPPAAPSPAGGRSLGGVALGGVAKGGVAKGGATQASVGQGGNARPHGAATLLAGQLPPDASGSHVAPGGTLVSDNSGGFAAVDGSGPFAAQSGAYPAGGPAHQSGVHAAAPPSIHMGTVPALGVAQASGAPARPRRAVTATAQSWQNMLPQSQADGRKKVIAVFAAILTVAILAIVLLVGPNSGEPEEPTHAGVGPTTTPIDEEATAPSDESDGDEDPAPVDTAEPKASATASAATDSSGGGSAEPSDDEDKKKLPTPPRPVKHKPPNIFDHR